MGKPEEHWYVVRTDVRCERRAARSLRSGGYRVYLPTRRKNVLHRRSRKRLARRIALLPGYVFVRLTRFSADGRPDWYTLHACNGVRAVLGIDGEPLAIPRDEVIRIVRVQRSRKYDDAKLDRPSGRKRRKELQKVYRRGRRVRVIEGPFIGRTAEVSRVTAQGNIAALLRLFSQLVPVELNADHLEAIDKISDAA